MSLTELFVRTQPGGIRSIVDISRHPSNVFFVGSAAIVGGQAGVDASGKGRSPATPLATIAAAIALCSNNQGDVIYVLPGHNEGLGDAQITVNKSGISIIGLGADNYRPRIDFDHANASIDIAADGVTIRDIDLLPSVTGVAIGIDVNAGKIGTRIDGVEALPGEDGAGVDEFALVVDVKAGCSRTKIRRLKVRQQAAAAHVVAGIKLTGASDDVLIEDCDIVAKGAAAVAPINGDTTLSTNLRIRRCTLVSDDEPGIELLTGTEGVIQDTDIFSNLATIAAATVADGMAHFGVRYVEVGNESAAVVKTASVDD